MPQSRASAQASSMARYMARWPMPPSASTSAAARRFSVDRDVRAALGQAAAQAIGIPRQQPDAVAVDAMERGMQHGPGGGLGRLGIGAGRSAERRVKSPRAPRPWQSGSSGDLAAEFVLDVDADDVLEARSRP